MKNIDIPRTLTSTFLHLPGIGKGTEERIWRQGITSWRSFIKAKNVIGISKPRKTHLDRILKSTQNELEHGDITNFLKGLPFGELWRTYPLLDRGARFLDIETTGLSRNARVTVIGIAWFDGKERSGQPRIRYRALVRGFDLTRSDLSRVMKGATAVVTFNGSTFDLPMIKRELGDVMPNIPHMDLRFMAKKVDLSGGLKSLERTLGIARDAQVQMIAGNDAVRLWHAWERKGHKRALELLVDYNREDVVNLAPLASIIYGRLEKRHLDRIGIGRHVGVKGR